MKFIELQVKNLTPKIKKILPQKLLIPTPNKHQFYTMQSLREGRSALTISSVGGCYLISD